MRRRRNIVVDDRLLETARKVTGEKTYSATITKALEDAVRRHNFQAALTELHEEAAKGDFWDRDYVEQMWPEVAQRLWPRRRSAHQRRLPREKGRKR
jgi:Arc/MetJ family transcription regulator